MIRAGTMAIVGLATGLMACSSPSSPPANPIAPSDPNPVVSAVSGFVADSAFRPLNGARVEIADGLQAGTSTTTDATGHFTLPGPFDNTTRLRASQQGYVPAAQVLTADHRYNCGSNGCLGNVSFYLAPSTPSVDIHGDYTLSFVADSACTNFPDEVRTRTYGATIQSASTPQPSPRVTLNGASFFQNFNSFAVGVAGDYADFWLDGEHDPPVVEQLAPNTYLAFSGDARAKVSEGAPVISTPFEGWIEFCVTKSPMGANYNCGTSNTTGEPIPDAVVVRSHCQSANHRLVLTRR